MYKVEIDISAWGGNEKVVIETNDFDKVQILQEFIDMQMDNGWCVDYEMIEDNEEDDDEDFGDEFDDEDEPSTVSTHIITTIDDNDFSKSSTVIVKTEV
jgi:hypothetical protein